VTGLDHAEEEHMVSSPIVVRRAADRFFTATDGIESWHCFSFGAHYDPERVGCGPLVALNDIVVEQGSGFPPHRHSDVEIVTWVMSQLLHHEDSAGNRGDIAPGVVQRLSAGSGVLHTEGAAEQIPATGNGADPTRFIQMWLVPDEPGGRPDYAQKTVDAGALDAGLAVVASGRATDRDTALPIACRGAALRVGRLARGQTARLPDADLVHLYVARGSIRLEPDLRLDEGDSACLTHFCDLDISAVHGSEILVWELDSAPESA
jgi:quercetin 2,3-dioxygenase